MSYDQTETYVLNFENVTHEDAAKHIAVYFLWSLHRNLLSNDFFDEADLDDVKKNKITAVEALEKFSDYHLLEDMFNELGNEFTEYYYDELYINDYTNTFSIKTDPEFFNINLDITNLKKILHVLDFRFSEWIDKKTPIEKINPEHIQHIERKPKNIFSDMSDEETALVTTHFFSQIKKSNTLIFIGLLAGILGIGLALLDHKFTVNENFLVPVLSKTACGLYAIKISTKLHKSGTLIVLLSSGIVFTSNFLVNYSNLLFPLYAVTLLFFYKLNAKLHKFILSQLA